jgi:hypothetical protein
MGCLLLDSTANSKAEVISSRCAIFRPATAEFRIIITNDPRGYERGWPESSPPGPDYYPHPGRSSFTKCDDNKKQEQRFPNSLFSFTLCKNKYFVIPRLKFFSQRAQRERRGREGGVNHKLKEDMALFTVK